MSEFKFYLAQRLSAFVMAPLVFGHIAVMIYAVRGGLNAGEILARTQGSLWWASFYGLFVAAVSVHASLGLRVIIFEYLKITGTRLNLLTLVVGLALFGLGARAVAAVVL